MNKISVEIKCEQLSTNFKYQQLVKEIQFYMFNK